MPPPTPLAKATSSVTRLLRDEERYRTELAEQQAQLQRLKDPAAASQIDDAGDAGNREYILRQHETALKETEAVFAPLRDQIAAATRHLESLLAQSSGADTGEVEKAREAVARAEGKEDLV